jgi:hypothetical protein
VSSVVVVGVLVFHFIGGKMTESDIHHHIMLIRNAVMKADEQLKNGHDPVPHLEIFAVAAQFFMDLHAIAKAHRKVTTS